ncbi:hypothetical protein [Pusillimonas sp. ANT_WB101]|uniref:hypothetical protein n=1 Tax=Pusillimonas sp. ANT_WB101 TaxID=2597356 RepID=UPI0011EEF2C2|nr:hypothetical protein [Pusillimonas sp. ANT_WB101]KAA0910653.1 hypothetical protein FQ179_01895 [Pusillimonas sp. ANT_WB101]
MFNARALLAALLGRSMGGIGAMNITPESYAAPGKKRRKADYFRQDIKSQYSGYPGAKLARKALLGEIGTARPQ